MKANEKPSPATLAKLTGLALALHLPVYAQEMPAHANPAPDYLAQTAGGAQIVAARQDFYAQQQAQQDAFRRAQDPNSEKEAPPRVTGGKTWQKEVKEVKPWITKPQTEQPQPWNTEQHNPWANPHPNTNQPPPNPNAGKDIFDPNAARDIFSSPSSPPSSNQQTAPTQQKDDNEINIFQY